MLLVLFLFLVLLILLLLFLFLVLLLLLVLLINIYVVFIDYPNRRKRYHDRIRQNQPNQGIWSKSVHQIHGN